MTNEEKLLSELGISNDYSDHSMESILSYADKIRHDCYVELIWRLGSVAKADIIKWEGPGIIGGAMSNECFTKTLEYSIIGKDK